MWLKPLRDAWLRRQLRDPAYGFLFDAPPADEWISIDCETTGLDARRDHILSVGAVPVRGRQVLTSQRLALLIRPDADRAPLTAENVRIHRLRAADLAEHGVSPLEAARRVLDFIGPRPLVGYHLAFDVALLNRLVRPLIGIPLPNTQIEVSGLYHDLRHRQQPGAHIDLRLDAIMDGLGLPRRAAHDPVNDATMAALAFVKLHALRTG